MMVLLLKLSIGVLLFLCGIQDMRNKKISLWIVLFGAMIVSIIAINTTTLSLINRFAGLGVGIFVIIISLLTGGKIGMGDGLLLCVTGIGLGFWSNLELFALALLIAAIVSVFLLAFRLANRKKSIPFIPFLFFSFLGLLMIPIL